MRSQFSIEQIAKAAQRLAHEIPTFHKVTSANLDIEFYYNSKGECYRVRVTRRRRTGKKAYVGTAYEHEEVEYLGFGAEPKLYYSSGDSTKISIGDEADRKFAEQWLADNMRGVTPQPRFSLVQIEEPTKNPRRARVERSATASP
jgi:hypothetical protein